MTWHPFSRNRLFNRHRPLRGRRSPKDEHGAEYGGEYPGSTFNLLRDLETKLEAGLGEVLGEIHGVRESLLAIKTTEPQTAGQQAPATLPVLSPSKLQQIFNMTAMRIEQLLRDPEVLITRETICQLLARTLVETGISEHHILKRHTPMVISGELDMWVALQQVKPLAIKTRSDRSLASGVNQPRTHKAGELFKEIRSLAEASEKLTSRSYLVYVTSAEMAGYFSNPNNRHQQIFNLQPGAQFVIQDGYFGNRPQTLMNVIGEPFQATLKCIDARSLPQQHQLRVFEVS